MSPHSLFKMSTLVSCQYIRPFVAFSGEGGFWGYSLEKIIGVGLVLVFLVSVSDFLSFLVRGWVLCIFGVIGNWVWVSVSDFLSFLSQCFHGLIWFRIGKSVF